MALTVARLFSNMKKKVDAPFQENNRKILLHCVHLFTPISPSHDICNGLRIIFRVK